MLPDAVATASNTSSSYQSAMWFGGGCSLQAPKVYVREKPALLFDAGLLGFSTKPIVSNSAIKVGRQHRASATEASFSASYQATVATQQYWQRG